MLDRLGILHSALEGPVVGIDASLVAAALERSRTAVGLVALVAAFDPMAAAVQERNAAKARLLRQWD